jgi:hypothetical protein
MPTCARTIAMFGAAVGREALPRSTQEGEPVPVRGRPTATVIVSALILPALSVALTPSLGASTTSSRATPAVLLTPAAARPVTPVVRAVPAHPTDGLAATTTAAQPSRTVGVVGATWRGTAPSDLRLAVRTRTDKRWSPWTPLEADVADHGPDPDTAEARSDRPGTDPVVVGDVDLVQLRATSRTGRVPRDLRLSLVNPGTSPADDDPVSREPVTTAAAVRAARPRIRSRAAWGADERLRSGRPSYGRVRAGFVHHTVNANGYSRADVPAIIRGIYAYHTQGLGWSDIGYNFLVDRFGRIWEGRFGGVRRNVIGAHTYGYNHLSFAMSAIGNFQTTRPSRAVRRAYGRLMAWKLALNGVRAGSRQQLRGRTLRAISGHRDAGQTACPGRRLYRRIPAIRRTAVRIQQRDTQPQPTPTPTPTPTATPDPLPVPTLPPTQDADD